MLRETTAFDFAQAITVSFSEVPVNKRIPHKTKIPLFRETLTGGPCRIRTDDPLVPPHQALLWCGACNPAPFGGDSRIRTDDPLLAKQMLYQLSYIPNKWGGATNCPAKPGPALPEAIGPKRWRNNSTFRCQSQRSRLA